MESQMVQNSRNKIGLTFNKIVSKAKTDFGQAQQNQFTFNRFSLKVKTFRIKLNKMTSSLSRNYLSRARDIWDKLKRSFSVLSTKKLSQFHASFHINPKFPNTFQQLDLSRSSRECCQQPKYFVNNHAKRCQQSSKQIPSRLFMKYLSMMIYSGFEACIEHTQTKLVANRLTPFTLSNIWLKLLRWVSPLTLYILLVVVCLILEILTRFLIFSTRIARMYIDQSNYEFFHYNNFPTTELFVSAS